jgi:adenylate cyclase
VWPPPRTVFADLIDGLLDAGAAVVALDVVFPQAQSAETDQALADALRRHPGKVVLAANFQPVGAGHDEGEKLLLPMTPFRQAAATGFVNLSYDADGAIHRFVPFHNVDLADPSLPRRFPSFDVAIAQSYMLGRAPAWLTDQPGGWLINYAGPPGHFQSASLTKVLEAIARHDQTYLRQFKGGIALVGATSLRLQDQYPTPFSATVLGGGSATYMPGVEIHANVVQTLLAGNPIRRVPDGVRLALMLAIGLVGAWGLTRLKPWLGAAAALVAGAGLVAIALGLFSAARLWLDVTAPLFLVASLYVAAVIEHFTRAELSRQYVRKTFEAYVAPEIVGELLKNPGLSPKLGGERREVSVLFSDVRNFTTISEQRQPEEVVEFLNAYLTAMADVIFEQQGCIDKYIGDAILALWGNVAPLPPAEAATRAVRAALGMKAKVEELRPHWEAKGFPYIDIGIGVNTGDAVVGNIGSPRKMEFGVIGDSINVASRLEGLTKNYDGALLISGRTRELIGDRFACTFLEFVKVKGREQPVEIYRVDRELAPGELPAPTADLSA